MKLKRFHCDCYGIDPINQPCSKKFNKKETFIKHLKEHRESLIFRMVDLAKSYHVEDIANFLMTGSEGI